MSLETSFRSSSDDAIFVTSALNCAALSELNPGKAALPADRKEIDSRDLLMDVVSDGSAEEFCDPLLDTGFFMKSNRLLFFSELIFLTSLYLLV